MSLEYIKQIATTNVIELGRAALHSIAPNDFEYYAFTFELLDSQGVIEDIFHFPVNPSSISIARNSLVSIKKTGKTYLSQFNESFVSRDINLSGTFGRKFRIMLNSRIGKNRITDDSEMFKFIDANIKTGYGAVKLLERIIENSQKLDDYGNPKILVLYNFAMNHSHIVEVMNFTLQQSLENNMMWNWDINLKSLADVNDLLVGENKQKNLQNLLLVASLNKVTNDIFSRFSESCFIKPIL